MTETPSNDRSVNFGELGGSTAMDFWNSLLDAGLRLFQQQARDWSDLFRQAVTGDFQLDQWVRSSVSMSMRWFSLAAFPSEWWARYMRQLPTLFFVVDEQTEALRHPLMPTPFIVPDHDVHVTDLVRIGGPVQQTATGEEPPVMALKNEPPARCVEARLSADGSRLDVGLVSLLNQDLDPGFYFGMVYAHSQVDAQRIPLALVYVYASLQARRPANPVPTDTPPAAST